MTDTVKKLDLDYIAKRMNEHPFPSDQTKTEWIAKLIAELREAREEAKP